MNLNRQKIERYQRTINRKRFANLDAAFAGCIALGDGNYRVTLDSDQPFAEENSFTRQKTGKLVLPEHAIEVRDGVAEYC